jgi:hypothetical protein
MPVIPAPAAAAALRARNAAKAKATAAKAAQAKAAAKGPLAKSPAGTFTPPGATNVPGGGGVSAGVINAPQIQAFLKAHGYDLKQTGQLDKATKLALANFIDPNHFNAGGALGQALKGFRITGARDPHQWNLANGGPTTRSKVVNPFNPATGHSIDPPSTAGTVDLRGLGAIAAKLGIQNIDPALAAQIANSTADAKDGTAISDAQLALSHDPTQAKQNLADIGNWYGQVASARKTAAGRDTAISGAGISSMKDALAAIESSLGGSANAGTSSVANTGANDIGTLTALGANEDQYNADLAPLLALESSSAKSSQVARDANTQQLDRQKLTDAQSQRGADYGATYGPLLMQILQQNNAYKQQGFTNKLAISQAAEAAQLSGLKALQLAQKTTVAPVQKGSFSSATPAEINGVKNALLPYIIDPTTHKALPGMTAAKAAALAAQVAGTYFPQGGVPMGWAQQVVSPYFQTP